MSWLYETCLSPPVIFLLTVQRGASFVDLFLLFVFCLYLCHIVLSVFCSHVVTYWERTDLIGAHLYMMLSCVFVTFPYGVLGQLRYLIVLMPNLCCLSHL